MGSFSPVHFIILILVVLGMGVPIWRILKRLGFNPFWALVCFVPFGGLIGLWVLAYARWPNLPNAADQFS